LESISGRKRDMVTQRLDRPKSRAVKALGKKRLFREFPGKRRGRGDRAR
jgi:hypothetical protein